MIKSALELGFAEGDRHHDHFVVAVAGSEHKAMVLEDVLDLTEHLGGCEVIILPHPSADTAQNTAELIQKHGISRVQWK